MKEKNQIIYAKVLFKVHRRPGSLTPVTYLQLPISKEVGKNEIGTLSNESVAEGQPTTGWIRTTGPLDNECLESITLTTWPPLANGYIDATICGEVDYYNVYSPIAGLINKNSLKTFMDFICFQLFSFYTLMKHQFNEYLHKSYQL